MLNWSLYLALIASLMLSLLTLALDLADHWWLEPRLKLHQEQLLNKQASFASWESSIAQHALLTPLPTESDITTVGQTLTQTNPSMPNSPGTLHLTDLDAKRTLIALGQRWLDKPHVLKSNATIASFFAQVAQARTLQELPQPQEGPMELVAAAQLYLGEAYWTPNPEVLEGRLLHVGQLSRLLISSESMEDLRAGLSIAQKFEEVRARSRKVGSKKASADQRKDHWTVQWTQNLNHLETLLSHLTPPEILTALFLDHQPFAFCPVLLSRWQALAWERSYLEPQWPGERNFHASAQVIGEIEARGEKICRSFPKDRPAAMGTLHRIPYYRRLYALNVLLKKYR